MTKTKKSILVCLLASLVLAFGVTGVVSAKSANATAGGEFSNAYVNLSDDITLYFGLENLDANVNYDVKFTFLNEQTTVENIPVSTDGKANVPFALVTPKYIGEKVKAELFVDGAIQASQTKTYSVKEYLYDLLSSSAETLDLSCAKYSAVKTLATDMLFYGAAAQKKYLGAADDALVTAELTDAQKKYASAFVELPASLDDRALAGDASNEYSWVSAGIRFDYKVSLYFVIKPTDANAELSLKIGDDYIADYEADGNARKYRYAKVSVLDFAKTLEVSVVNSEKQVIGQTLSYSVNGYVFAKQNDADMGEMVKATYNYGAAAKAYAQASNGHSYKLIPDYGTDYASAEATLGEWITCEHCGKKTYTQYATAANPGGNVKTTENGPYEYVYVSGDRTQEGSYEKTSTRAALASTSYNMKDGAQTYAFTVDATAGKAKVIIRARNTNRNSKGYNEEYQLNKSLTLTVNGTVKNIPASVVLNASPEFSDGAAFDEYVLSVADLTDGSNEIVLTFTPESKDSTGKPKGVYLQYMRLETVEVCKGAHNLAHFDSVPADYYTDGVAEHYECVDCGLIFKADKVTETTEAELEIARPHVFDVCEKVDESTHKKTCILCGDTVTENHSEGGGRHLVVARKPNRVWYYEGETLKDKEEDEIVYGDQKRARMKLYLSTLCADGCGDLTEYTGEYTVTYRNGTAFTEGDTFVTLTAIVDGNEYTGVLDGLTVVKSSDDMLNVDDKDIEVVSGAFGKRGNDMPGVQYIGQAAYGGYYVHEIQKSVTFTFDSAKTSGRLTVQAGNNNPGTDNPKKGIKINGQIEVYLNGVKIEIDDSKVLHGTVGQKKDRWAWTVWETIDLGNVTLNAGENIIEIKNINTVPDSNNKVYALVDIDCFNIFY